VTLAAALYHAHELPPAKKIAIIMSGGNVDPALLETLKEGLVAEVATAGV
jgi:threonine dehydratase